MFTTTSIYFLLLFCIFWSYCGYIIVLFICSALNPQGNRKKVSSRELPKMAIFVPCCNEEDYVREKVENLAKLDYEQDKLNIFFLNGLSQDNTSGEINKFITDRPGWHLIETNCSGKINQINYGLSKIKGDADIIVSTDMDTVLSPDTLIKFAGAFNSDTRVAVVGANISPQDCIFVDEVHWRDQNILRIVESSVYTSSIVVAPCYAYRASLIDRFPGDCIADDIYIAFKANTEGYITKYIESAKGIELRTPCSFEDFFRHKFRKGNAYLMELFRYFYQLPRMSGWWKVIYITKFLQLAVLPWILPYFLLSTISLFFSGRGLFQIALFAFIFLFISLLLTSFLMRKARLRYLGGKSRNRITLLNFIISNSILILVGLTYPFYKQTSNYKKIGQKATNAGG